MVRMEEQMALFCRSWTNRADEMPDRKAVYPFERNGAKAILDGEACEFPDAGAGDLATGDEA